MMQMQIEAQEYQKFQSMYKAGRFSGQRFGQAFFNHFQLHKCPQNKPQLDRLYQLDGEDAKQRIRMLFELT